MPIPDASPSKQLGNPLRSHSEPNVSLPETRPRSAKPASFTRAKTEVLEASIKKPPAAPEAEEDCEGPMWSVSYSETSGTIAASIRDVLLRLPHWRPGPSPQSLRSSIALERLPVRGIVLGDRVPMLDFIKDTKEYLRRFGRSTNTIEQVVQQGCRDIVLVNNYAGARELTLKSNMVRVLKGYMKCPWDITPLTFVIKPGSGALDQRTRFLDVCGAMKDQGQRLWIVKNAHMNRATGIRVMKNGQQIIDFIDNHEDRGEWVVQKYIENPLLIHGRKFDIRAWVLVGPRFDIYLWTKGVIRTSSEKYDPADTENRFAHLTNHCLQETGPNFSKFEHNNLMTYEQLQDHMDQHHPGYSFRRDAVPRMKDIIRTCFQAGRSFITQTIVNPRSTMCCFQVFGFDFMLDDTFKPWLIEINGFPWVAEDLLEEFATDIMELIINPIFPYPGWKPAKTGFEEIDSSGRRMSV